MHLGSKAKIKYSLCLHLSKIWGRLTGTQLMPDQHREVSSQGYKLGLEEVLLVGKDHNSNQCNFDTDKTDFYFPSPFWAISLPGIIRKSHELLWFPTKSSKRQALGPNSDLWTLPALYHEGLSPIQLLKRKILTTLVTHPIFTRVWQLLPYFQPLGSVLIPEFTR